jgi:hypothetical protein
MTDMMNPGTPEMEGRAGTWSFKFSAIATTIRVERVSKEHSNGAMYADVVVDCKLPVTGFFNRVGGNIKSGTFKKQLVTDCTSNNDSIDWAHIFTLVFEKVVEKKRQGDPVVRLAEVQPSEAIQWQLYPMLPMKVATVLFAPGGSLKSWMAARIAVVVATGAEGAEPANVLVLDWDSGKDDWAQRTRMVSAGMGIDVPLNVQYKRMGAALADDMDEINRIVQEDFIGMVIVDHAAGSAGEAETAVETNRVYDALHQMNVTSLILAHVTNEGDKGRPFGSAFWTNRARVTWEQKRTREGGDSVEVGIFQRKSNVGKIQPNLAWRVDFAVEDDRHYTEGDFVQFTPINASEVPEFDKEMSGTSRVMHYLTSTGKGTLQEIASALGMQDSNVRTYLWRLAKDGKVARDEQARYYAVYQQGPADAHWVEVR